jgi:hypothetical protein
MPIDKPALRALAAERLDQRAHQIEGLVHGILVGFSSALTVSQSSLSSLATSRIDACRQRRPT